MIVYTTAILINGTTWTSDVDRVGLAQYITGTVYADQAGTLYVEQSTDGSNWDVSDSYIIAAADGKGFREIAVGELWRIRYVNGAVTQGEFRLYAKNRI